VNAPQLFLRRLRRLVLVLVGAALLYGYVRFDVVLLPEGALSPLYGIHAGDRLLVDRRARTGAPGETWLFRGPEQALLLGRVEEPPASLAGEPLAAVEQGALWILFERAVPGLADSSELGPIAPEALVGRVVLVLPW
jgi:hypothetical protein